MKIAIDMTSFGAKFRGGKEQVVCNLIEGIQMDSPKTRLLLFCYEDFIEKAKLLAPEAEFVIFKRWGKLRFFKDLINRTLFFKKHLGDFDVLFFPIYYTGFRKFKIPTVVLPHDIQFKSCPGNFDAITRVKENILYRIDFKLRDYIIAISEFDKGELKEHYPEFVDKIVYIPNPIKVFEPSLTRKRTHLLAVNIGFAHKNADVIVKAYAKVKDRLKLPLVLVGKLYDPISLDELINRLELNGSIIMPGYVSEDELADLMVNAYAYVTASGFEGFGMPSVEALMYRIPVVSSDQKALMEVTFGKAKYFSPADDSDALAKRLLELADDYPEDDYLDMQRERAIKEYGYINVAGQYMQFFKKITCRVIYCDPMSYSNLAAYDMNLLKRIKNAEVMYVANVKFAIETDIKVKKIYHYSDQNILILKALSYLLSQMRLMFLVRQFKAGVLHLQWSRMPKLDNFMVKILKKHMNLKFIYTSHDTFTHNKEESGKSSFMLLMKNADEIIVHTETAKKVMEAHGFSNISVNSHGLLKLDEIYPGSVVSFDKGDKIVFSILGYMEAYKGTDILLDAWLASKKLLFEKNIQLIVAGVNRMGFVPDLPTDCNITFIDRRLEDSEFTAWMGLSDVVVMPYQRISQSGLLLSALAMGKNVIVSDVGEMAEPVKRHDVGWVIDAGEIRGLMKQLEIIVDDILSNGLKVFDKCTIDDIDREYSWDDAAKKTRVLYDKQGGL